MRDYRTLNAAVPRTAQRLVDAMLQTHTEKNTRAKREKVSKQPALVGPTKKLSDAGKLACVALRFGSLTDFDKPLMNCCQVAKALKVSWPVVVTACDNWVKYGQVKMPPRPVGNRRRQLPEHVEKHVLSDHTLKAMRFLSLRQRCERLQAEVGLKISPHGLSNLYRRHGIGWRFARPQKRCIVSDPDHLRERKEAAEELLRLLASDQQVCFLDEMSI